MPPADRPMIWASDLARGSLPKVCVRSGRPSDTILNFSFATQNDEHTKAAVGVEVAETALHLASEGLGMAGSIVGRALLARRASGFLPVTSSQRRLIRILRKYEWICVLGGPLLFAVGMLGGIAVPWSPVVGLILMVVGGSLLLSFLPWLVVKRFIFPQGRVLAVSGASEYLVELSRVHPNFVAALKEMNAARTAP